MLPLRMKVLIDPSLEGSLAPFDTLEIPSNSHFEVTIQIYWCSRILGIPMKHLPLVHALQYGVRSHLKTILIY